MRLLLLILVIFTFNLRAEESVAPAMNFQTWKDQQILEAQNQVLRISTRLSQNKTGKSSATELHDLPSSRIKKTAEASSERDLKRAQDNLEAANALGFEEYVNVYIPTLQDEPELLAKLTEKMTREELTMVVKSLVKHAHRPDNAKHNNGAYLEGLTFSSHTKSF